MLTVACDKKVIEFVAGKRCKSNNRPAVAGDKRPLSGKNALPMRHVGDGGRPGFKLPVVIVTCIDGMHRVVKKRDEFCEILRLKRRDADQKFLRK